MVAVRENSLSQETSAETVCSHKSLQDSCAVAVLLGM